MPIRISGNTIFNTSAPQVSSIVFLSAPAPAVSTISTVTTANTATISGGAVLFGKTK